MKYMMLVCVDPNVEVAEPEPVEPWVEENDARGTRVLGDALRPLAEAATVRVRDGEVLVTDGPFAETKEVIAGFDILECQSMEEAIDIASKHPVAKFGLLEIRQFLGDS
ncbi:YciI family protein [Glycomyces tarimensis]